MITQTPTQRWALTPDRPFTTYAVTFLWMTNEKHHMRTRMFCVSGKNPLTEAEAIARAEPLMDEAPPPPFQRQPGGCVNWSIHT